jgi:PAS domain S-box-containing protein
VIDQAAESEIRELREQARILQSVLGSMGDGVAVAAPDGRLILFNPEASRILGRGPTDAPPETWSRHYGFFLPDQVTPHPPDQLPLVRALRGEEVKAAEIYLRHPGVTQGIWLSINARPLHDESGNVCGAVTVFRDMSELKRREVELRHSRERFELAVSGSGDGIWDWDLASNTVYFSPRWKNLLGYEDNEIPNLFPEWERRVHPDDRARARETIISYFNDPTAPCYELEHRLKHKDGSYRWILSRGLAVRDSAGRPLRMAGSHTDITKLKEMITALGDSESLYHSLVETFPLSIFRKDRDGRFTFGNGRFLATLGITLEELRGRTDFDFYPHELAEKYRADDHRVMTTRESFDSVEEHIKPHGEKLFVQVIKTPVYDARGQVVGVQVLFWDVTEKKLADEALRRAREVAESASRSKSEFLANMSHEIRTPMNAVVGMTELLLGTSLEPEQRDYLEMVRKSADSLMSVINDILDFSKIEAGKMDLDHVAFDLREVVGDTLATLALRAHQKGLELVCHIAPDVPAAVVGDPQRLRQVLVNLVGNAIKFTDGGEVLVSVESQNGTDSENPQSAICKLQFSVSDTGIGIPVEKQKLIFDPFAQADGSSTRKYGGTGLGLTISARLVEMMGGRLAVESEPGRGSTFGFTLPFTIAQEPMGRPADPERVRGLSVLVVDDNATNRRILVETLAHWEMQPLAVDSGEAALRLLEQAHAEGEPVALVILDAQMPGMDGFALAERIRRQPDLVAGTVMMLSSSGQPGSVARRRELGIASYLTKPVRQADLWTAILEALGTDEKHAAPAAAPVPTATGRPLRILLAEDNVFNQRLAVGLLEREGHSVVVTGDGHEALAALQREAFDLVLMDVQMPGLDGLDATRIIRQRESGLGQHLPIVAMTAYAMKGDRERCLDAGMDAYVSKPIRASELYAALAATVGESNKEVDPQEEGPATAADLDWNTALERVGGDRHLLCDVIRLFLKEYPGWIGEMHEALAAGNTRALTRIGHNLKSCLGTIGARSGFELALNLERLGRNGILTGAEDVCRSLEEMLTRLRPELVAFTGSEVPEK